MRRLGRDRVMVSETRNSLSMAQLLSTLTRRRLANQGLAGPPLAGPEEVVGWMGAVQAQDYPAARWAVAQRTASARETDLDRLLDQGAIVRTHVLRPTWHLVLPRDLRWLLALTGPRVHAASARGYREFGLDGALLARSDALLGRTLGGGVTLTRTELAAALRGGGIPAEGTRLAHILMHAELEAVIVSGGRRGKQMTYALLDGRVPPARPLSRTEALAELARRYFASHGPATAADAAWWSGLTVADVKTGIAAAGLASLMVGGEVYWTAASDRARTRVPADVVHLLPSYDEYLVAYQNRAAALHPALAGSLSGMQ